MLGVEDDSILEYHNLKEFHNWIISLKSEDVKNEKISQQILNYQKSRLYAGKNLNHRSKTVKILWEKYINKPKNQSASINAMTVLEAR